MWEDVQRDNTRARIFREAHIFKVQSQTYKQTKTDRYIKIYDINRYPKVLQKLAGHMALKVDSLEKAKRLFQVETDGLASMACMAGMVNRTTNTGEMRKLQMEMSNNHTPRELYE